MEQKEIEVYYTLRRNYLQFGFCFKIEFTTIAAKKIMLYFGVTPAQMRWSNDAEDWFWKLVKLH